MSYKGIGAFRPYFEAPQHIPEHQRDFETERVKVLTRRLTERFQQRHPSRLSESDSNLYNKIWAVFFLYLLVSNDSCSSLEGPRSRYRPHPKTNPQRPRLSATRPEPEANTHPTDLAPQAVDPSQNASATESPTFPRPEQSEDDSLWKSAINTIGTSWAPLLLGPFGGLLSLSTPASSQAVSDKLSKFLEPLPGGLGGKAIAEGFPPLVKSFNTYVKKNPERSETILEASTLAGSMLAGLYVGIPEGPPGMALGVLSGAAIHVTAEWGGKVLYEVFPKQINFMTHTAVDALAKPLQGVFPSFDETDARMAASGGVLLWLSALHLRSIGKAVGEGVVGAAMTTGEGMALHALGEADTEITYIPRRKEESQVPMMDLLPDFPGEPGTAFYELLHKAQKNAYESSTKAFEEATEASAEAIYQRMDHADQMDETQRAQVTIEIAQADAKYYQARDSFGDSLVGLSALLQISGNFRAAEQVIRSGPAALKVVDSLHQISIVASVASSTASGAMAGAKFGPYVALGTALLSFVASFINSDNDGLQEMYKALYSAIYQMYTALSSQIEGLREEMLKGLNAVQDQISIFEYYTMLEFFKTGQQIHDHHASTSYLLDRIDRHIKAVVDVLKPMISADLAQAMIESCTAIELYTARTNSPLGSMPEEEVRKHCGVLEGALLGKTIPHECFNGNTCKDFSPHFVNENLQLSPGDLFAYLGTIAQDISGKPLQSEIDPSSLPNLKLFLYEAEHYLTLLQAILSFIQYDNNNQILGMVMGEGHRLHQFIVSIQKNKELFENLLTKLYKPNLDALQPTFNMAFERKAQEVLANVYENAMILNRQELDKVPWYRKARGNVDEMATHLFADKIDSLLESKYKEMKSSLVSTLKKSHDDKQRFALSLAKPKKAMLEGCEKTPLNAFVMPKNPQLPPLAFAEIAPKIKGYIPDDAFIGERAGFGILELHYSGPPQHRIVDVDFRKKDNSHISLGSILLEGTETDPLASAVIDSLCRLEPSFGVALFSGFIYDAINSIRSFALSNPAPAIGLTSFWKTAVVKKWTPVPGASEALSAFVDGELVKMRKEALHSMFYGETALVSWGKSLEALDAPINLLKAYCTIAGCSEEEMAELSKLLSAEAITSYHQKYLAGSVSAETALLPLQSDEEFSKISSTILSRFNRTLYPWENPFSFDLRRLLKKFATFSEIHKAAVQKRAEKTKHGAAAEREEADSLHEVRLLKNEVGALRSQIEEMTKLMQQLVLKQQDSCK